MQKYILHVYIIYYDIPVSIYTPMAVDSKLVTISYSHDYDLCFLVYCSVTSCVLLCIRRETKGWAVSK